jgi:putative oxidoreductase
VPEHTYKVAVSEHAARTNHLKCQEKIERVLPNFTSRFPVARWAPLPLRLIVGYGFLQHGFAKIAKGPESFAAILHAIGVPGAHFMAWSTIAIEVFGGLAVLLGAFVTLASLPMAIVLLLAGFSVHLRYGFSSIKLMAVTAAGAQFGPPGYETNLCTSRASLPWCYVAPDR